MKPSARFCFMSPLLRSFPVQTGHFDCDSRLIATFRRVFVLPRNLLMKYRLFGDLETIQHNRQSHNERFPPSPPFFLSRRVCSDGKRLRRKNNVEHSLKKIVFIPFTKCTKGKFHRSGFFTKLRTNERLYRQIMS